MIGRLINSKKNKIRYQDQMEQIMVEFQGFHYYHFGPMVGCIHKFNGLELMGRGSSSCYACIRRGSFDDRNIYGLGIYSNQLYFGSLHTTLPRVKTTRSCKHKSLPYCNHSSNSQDRQLHCEFVKVRPKQVAMDQKLDLLEQRRVQYLQQRQQLHFEGSQSGKKQSNNRISCGGRGRSCHQGRSIWIESEQSQELVLGTSNPQVDRLQCWWRWEDCKLEVHQHSILGQ